MHCDDVKRHWSLYHDSEGDANQHFRVSEHLAVCPDCADWFDQQSRFERLLTDKLSRETKTESTWSQVLHSVGIASELSRKTPRRNRFLAIAAMAAVVWIGVWTAYRWFPPGDDLAKASVAWHERLESGEETLQFRSASDLEVEQYLRSRVPFPVRCPPRKDAGFEVQGAGAFRMGDQPAAYLHGRVDTAPVSIFVLSRERLDAFPAYRRALQGDGAVRRREQAYEVVMAGIDRNAVLAVGRVDSELLNRVLRAYGTYPHEH